MFVLQVFSTAEGTKAVNQGTETDCTVTQKHTEVELEPNTFAFYAVLLVASTHFDAAQQHRLSLANEQASAHFYPPFPMMAAQLHGV